MNRRLTFILVTSCFAISACQKEVAQTKATNLCDQPWYQSVESAISSGDGLGHGPDIGSEEWRSVIEFRLGVRGNADVPDRSSDEWCSYIDGLIHD